MNCNSDISKQVHEVIFPHNRFIISHPPLIINNIPVAQTNVQKNSEAHLDKKTKYRRTSCKLESKVNNLSVLFTNSKMPFHD